MVANIKTRKASHVISPAAAPLCFERERPAVGPELQQNEKVKMRLGRKVMSWLHLLEGGIPCCARSGSCKRGLS